MRIEKDDKENLTLSEFYFPIKIENDTHGFISCRDDGFEIKYGNNFIELKGDEVIVTDNREKNINDLLNFKNLRLGQNVYHKDIYWGRERMKIVGLREKQVELEGDYSGGTHNVCQKEWNSLEGVLLERSEY